MQDPYSYPGTNVLRNVPGIKDPEKLSDFEYKMATLRELQLIEQPIHGKFDLKHLQGIHKELFKDTYDWAGEIRTVGISKGGSSFAQPGMIEGYANSTVFKDLQKDNYLRGMEKEQFVERLSHHFSEINALHPFREGNGRATRVFVEELGKQAGYSLDFDKVEPEAWIEASRASFNGRMGPIQEIFREIATADREVAGPTLNGEVPTAGQPKPDRAVAFQTLPMQEALVRHPELDGAYSELRGIAEDIDPELPQVAQQRMYSVAKETIGLQLERGEIPGAEEAPPRDELDTKAQIHNHAVTALEGHYSQLRENPSFSDHDRGELVKAAYFRGVYEKSSELKGESPNFAAYDGKMSDRATVGQLPDIPGHESREQKSAATISRPTARDDLSL